MERERGKRSVLCIIDLLTHCNGILSLSLPGKVSLLLFPHKEKSSVDNSLLFLQMDGERFMSLQLPPSLLQAITQLISLMERLSICEE